MTRAELADPGLHSRASSVLDRLVGLRADDSVLVVSDPVADEVILAAVEAAVRELKAEHASIAIPHVLQLGDELPRTVEAALAAADVVVLIVRWLPAWVAAKGFARAIHECGTRVLQLDPPYRLALENGLSDAELGQVTACARMLRRRVQSAVGVVITDRFGNELRCGVDPRVMNISDEFPFGSGFGKFPVGLFTLAVLPGTYEGRIAWDAVEGHPMGDGDLIEAEVAGGSVHRVCGRGAGMRHVAAKVAASPAYAQLTEFGLGINPVLSAERLLREPWHEGANRAAGIVHFGLGSAKVAGPGNRKFHTHLVASGTTVATLPDRFPLLTSGHIAPDV